MLSRMFHGIFIAFIILNLLQKWYMKTVRRYEVDRELKHVRGYDILVSKIYHRVVVRLCIYNQLLQYMTME